MATQRRHRFIKHCAYGLLMIVLFVLQNSRGTAIGLWGTKLDALPMLVAAIALFEGPYAGGAFGFLAGMLTAVHSPMVEGLSALYLGLFGIGFGWLGGGWLRRVFPASLLGGLSCILLQGMARYVFYSRLVYGLDAVSALMPLAAELLLAIVPGVPCYFAVRALNRRFTEE